MARPIHADSENTRNRILQIGIRHFSQQGQAQTTLRQIAKGAQVSMATIHHYFGSKAELYEACVDAMYSEVGNLRRNMNEMMIQGSQDDLPAFFKNIIQVAYNFARNHRNAIRLIMRNVIDTGALDQKKRDQHLLPFLEQTSSSIANLSGKSKQQVRMALISLNYLLVRHALNTPAELTCVVGAQNPDEANEWIVTHIADLFSTYLGFHS